MMPEWHECALWQWQGGSAGCLVAMADRGGAQESLLDSLRAEQKGQARHDHGHKEDVE